MLPFFKRTYMKNNFPSLKLINNSSDLVYKLSHFKIMGTFSRVFKRIPVLLRYFIEKEPSCSLPSFEGSLLL